jgi:hypothetical protein
MKKVTQYLLLSFSFLHIFDIQSFSWNPLSIITGEEEESISKDYSIEDHTNIDIENESGDILIKAWNQPKITLQAIKVGDLDGINNTFVHVEKIGKTLHIRTRAKGNYKPVKVHYVIYVPTTTGVKVKNKKGKTKIRNIDNPIYAYNEQGDISIHGINTVTAKAAHGNVKIKQKRLKNDMAIFIEARHGAHLALSADVNAHIHAKTINGKVVSSKLVTLDPITVQWNEETWNRLKRELKATIGTGDSPITIDVIKGNIQITEY